MSFGEHIVQLPEARHLDAWQPHRRCLIACKVGGELRTYEVRVPSYGEGWLVDFGGGGAWEWFASWERVVGWFEKLTPTSIEVLVDRI